MALSGSGFAILARMEERLRELADVPAKVSKKASEEIEKLMQEQFDQGTDAYGKAWKPLAPATVARGRGAPPLTDSGAMRGTLEVRPLPGAGVGITIDHPGGVHQTGWNGPQGKGPSRPIIPSRGSLPPAWSEVIKAEAVQAFRGVVRR